MPLRLAREPYAYPAGSGTQGQQGIAEDTGKCKMRWGTRRRVKGRKEEWSEEGLVNDYGPV